MNCFAAFLLAVELCLWWQEGWAPSVFGDLTGLRLQWEMGENSPFDKSLPRNLTLQQLTKLLKSTFKSCRSVAASFRCLNLTRETRRGSSPQAINLKRGDSAHLSAA